VQILIVPSSTNGPRTRDQFLTSFVINRTLAIDAGCLGLYGSVADQAAVRHVLVTHSHIDHVASLPVFVNQVYDGSGDCVTIHGSAAVLDSLRRDLFNGRVWPDFFHLSTQMPAYLKTCELADGRAVELEGLRVTPIGVNHVVPTMGFLVQDGRSSVLFSSDTGPTERIWEVASAVPDLKAVFLEVTFPDAMAGLADVSKHLTPATFGREAAKLRRPAAFVAVHVHPRYRNKVTRELKALRLPGLEMGRFGVPYEF
jgi:ribonuclease BN (tRNA processing enzyme)